MEVWRSQRYQDGSPLVVEGQVRDAGIIPIHPCSGTFHIVRLDVQGFSNVDSVLSSPLYIFCQIFPFSLFFSLLTVTKSVMLPTFRISKTSKRFVTSFPQSRDYLPPLPSQPEFKTSPLHPSPVPYDNSAAQQEPHQYHHLKHHQSQHLCYPPTLARRHHLP